jgi:hypothetical protein
LLAAISFNVEYHAGSKAMTLTVLAAFVTDAWMQSKEPTEFLVIAGHQFKITDTVLVAFTGFLVVVGSWQAFELNRTVRSVIRQERPFLRPTEITSFIQAGNDFKANKMALASFRLENYGRTPAILTEFRCEIVIRTEPPNPMTTRGVEIFHQEVISGEKQGVNCMRPVQSILGHPTSTCSLGKPLRSILSALFDIEMSMNVSGLPCFVGNTITLPTASSPSQADGTITQNSQCGTIAQSAE